MLPALGFMATGKAEINQGVQAGIGHGKYMSATPPIASIGAAELLVFFMPERNAACAAIASDDVNIGFINEFHQVSSLYRPTTRQNNEAPTRRGSVLGCERIKQPG